MLWGSKADKVHVWRITIKAFFFFARCVFQCRWSGYCLHVEDSQTLYRCGWTGDVGKMPSHLVCWTTESGFFSTSCKTRFDPELEYVSFRNGQEVGWSCVVLKNPFFFVFLSRAREVIDFADIRFSAAAHTDHSRSVALPRDVKGVQQLFCWKALLRAWSENYKQMLSGVWFTNKQLWQHI